MLVLIFQGGNLSRSSQYLFFFLRLSALSMYFGNKPAWSYKSCFSVWFVLQELSHEIVVQGGKGGSFALFLLENSINDWQILTFCCVSLDCHAVQLPQLHPATITSKVHLFHIFSVSSSRLPRRGKGRLSFSMTADTCCTVTISLGLAANPHLKGFSCL